MNERVREIAAIQRQRADILNTAGMKIRELQIAMSEKTDELEDIVTRRGNRNAAAEIAAAFAEYLVITGDLNCGLIDAIERRGHKVFPTQYKPIRAKWTLIKNRA